MNVLRIAAFSDGDVGGNPAGVVIADALPSEQEMQKIAAEVGFSETAFAVATGAGWRVRYFSPESEVPFCGHATIALGAALALKHGDGVFDLTLNQANITVEAAAMALSLRQRYSHHPRAACLHQRNGCLTCSPYSAIAPMIWTPPCHPR